jgi:hypothetical protein
MEVEAESAAYLVCNLLGVDAGSYSIPYVANWAGADVDLVQETARKVLATARAIVAGLEAELGVDLRPNPIADAITASHGPAAQPPRRRRSQSVPERPIRSFKITSLPGLSTGDDSPLPSRPSNRIARQASTTPPHKLSRSPKPARRQNRLLR